MKQSGFSFLEISIAISIMMLMVSCGLYMFNFYDRLFVHLELNRIYALIRSCSARAMCMHTPENILFSPDTGTYTAHQVTYELTPGVTFGILPEVQGPPAHPEQMLSSPLTFVGKKISIYPDGRVQPGTLYLTDTKKRWLYALTCPIGHVSYLRRYRYMNHEWVLLT
jgi:hypothetical protein